MRPVLFRIRNCKRWWRRIRDAKYNPTRKTLEDSSPKVEARYTAFFKARRALTTLKEALWTEDERAALLHCYSSRTQALRDLKAAAIETLGKDQVNLLRCPYCQIRNPRTWDHFAPQVKFPEYSVLVRNWVYVCFECNHAKDEAFELEPTVLNPYLDSFPSEPFLSCVVTVDNGVPTAEFSIRPPTEGEAAVLKVARRHFVTFDLNRQYQGEASDKLSSLVAELAMRFPNGVTAERLHEELEYCYSSVPIAHGANAWEAALWLGASKCADLRGAINETIASKRIVFRTGFPRLPREALGS